MFKRRSLFTKCFECFFFQNRKYWNVEKNMNIFRFSRKKTFKISRFIQRCLSNIISKVHPFFFQKISQMFIPFSEKFTNVYHLFFFLQKSVPKFSFFFRKAQMIIFSEKCSQIFLFFQKTAHKWSPLFQKSVHKFSFFSIKLHKWSSLFFRNDSSPLHWPRSDEVTPKQL